MKRIIICLAAILAVAAAVIIPVMLSGKSGDTVDGFAPEDEPGAMQAAGRGADTQAWAKLDALEMQRGAPAPEQLTTDGEAPADEQDAEAIGEFRVTVYTPFCDEGKWGYKTATGARSEHLKTCAVDPEVIPLGSVINVGGLELKAVDTGGAVQGKVIDVFYDGPVDEAYEWIKAFGTSWEVYEIDDRQ